MKKNRERPISKLLFFSEEELQIIQKKMQEAGMTNFSAYCREQLVKGEVRHYDFQVLKEQTAYIGRIAGSINQIAKRCNENKSVHKLSRRQWFVFSLQLFRFQHKIV